MKVISKFTVPSNSKTAPKAVLEPKPRASKKRAAAISPKKEEVKIETTPEVVSPLLVEEPEIAEVSDDIKEILANSEV
jgi:hypothetical protein